MCKELVKVQGVKLISHIHYASTISQQYSQMYNTQFTGKENEASDKIQMTQCIAMGTPAWAPNSTHWSPNHSPAVHHAALLFPPLGTAAHSYLFLHVLKSTENKKIMKWSVIQNEVSLSPFLYPPTKASEREPFGYLFLTFRFFPYSGLGI